MDVHFILDGKRVTRDNWNTLGPDVTRENLDRMADAILDVAEGMRCSVHAKEPSVTCRGPALRDVQFEVAGCCSTFEKAVADELKQKVDPARLVKGEVAGVVRVRTTRSKLRRLNKSFGPIIAGMFIDMVDLAMFGPIRVFVAFPAGAIAGYWMASIFALPMKQRILCAIAAGVYCVIPGLRFIPVATILGAYIRFQMMEDEARGGGD